MARIPGAQFNITGASGSQGLLTPKESWRCYVFPRGGFASQDSSGTTITFDSADVAGRYATNDWIQIGLAVGNIRQVQSVSTNTIVVNTAVTVTENDRIFLIGAVQPTVTGGSATYTTPDTTIRERDDDASGTITNSMLTSNSDGLIQFFSEPSHRDCLIQDGNQSNQGSITDFPVGLVEGVSTTQPSIFGATVTVNSSIIGNTVVVNMALGVTGSATFGSTVTINANGIVDRWRTAFDPANVFHPDYAALGDGSNDDATEIGLAITAAGTSGTVFLPPGEFIINSDLTLTTGIRLIGSGVDRTVIKTADGSPTTTAQILVTGDNVEIAHFTFDGNIDNQATKASGEDSIRISDGVDDVWIHDMKIMNSVSRGIFAVGTGTGCNRITVENCHITNTGHRGIELVFAIDSHIVNNKVITTGGHGIIVDTGTDKDTDYSRRCVIQNNIVDRFAAPTSIVLDGAETGFLIGYGTGSEDIKIADNILRGNTATSGQNDGIGWGHTRGKRMWRRVNITGNVVDGCRAFGIDPAANSVCANNDIFNAGTHGIAIAQDNEPDYGSVVISNNNVINCNARNSGSSISGIFVGFSGTMGADCIKIEGNNIIENRDRPQMSHGIIFKLQLIGESISSFIAKNNTVIRGESDLPIVGILVEPSAVSSSIVGLVDISGNDLRGLEGTGVSDSIRFSGNTHTNIVKVRVRDNNCIVNDPYNGEVALSSGTASVQNTSWPQIEGIRFAHWRRIRGSGTLGEIGTSYTNVDTVVIDSGATGAGENSTVHWEFLGTDD